VDSELGKAALIMGGFVPLPNPKKPGTFLFTDPDTMQPAVSTGTTTTPTTPTTPTPRLTVARPGTLTNNGTQAIIVQIKNKNGTYFVQTVQPGGTLPYPTAASYIRIFPTDLNNPPVPNVSLSGPNGETGTINQFNQKDSPPTNTQGAMAPGGQFGDEAQLGGGTQVASTNTGNPLGSEVHSGAPTGDFLTISPHQDDRHYN